MLPDTSLEMERAALRKAADAVRRGETVLGDSLRARDLLTWENELRAVAETIRNTGLDAFQQPRQVADQLTSIHLHARVLRVAVEAAAADTRLKLGTEYAEKVVRAARATVRTRCSQTARPLQEWRVSLSAEHREVSRGAV